MILLFIHFGNFIFKNFRSFLISNIAVFGLFFQSSNISIAQPHSEIILSDGVPTLVIDNKPYPPFAYMSYLGEKKFYKEIANQGIHLFNIPSYLGERGINSKSGIGAFRSPIWIGENKYDFSSLIKDFEEIIKSDPQAKVIIRLYLDPPSWWEKLNPDASCLLTDGSTFRQCFASEKWRNETGRILQYYINWVLDSPYAKYVAGIHVASGFTEEWFYHPQQYHDTNPVFTNAFRIWLKEKYKSTSNLQEVWNNDMVTFENALLANISEPNKRKEWRDPQKEQNYIDSYRFRAETMVDNIAYFCKIVKETSSGKLLTGAFYGYHYFVTDPRRGHGALAKLLDCPDLDYLSSPNDYNRVMGEDWPPMAAIQSVQLHGKLWLTENDTRTSITTLLKDRSTGIAPKGMYEDGVWLGPDSMDTSISLLWKNAGRMLAYNYGGWWFDMWGGWFSDPEILNVLGKTQSFYSDFIPYNKNSMQAQVAVIVDEELSFWDASYGKLTGNILSNRYPLAKTGAPYDLFLRTDLKNISSKQYQVIWLMGVIQLKEEEFSQIKKWKEQGITVLLTDQNGTTVSSREYKEYFYSNKFTWTNSELRDLWKRADVHVYLDTDDVFYIGNNWLCIHTLSGGKKTLNFPFQAQIFDPIKQQIMADSVQRIRINTSPNSTTLLRITPN